MLIFGGAAGTLTSGGRGERKATDITQPRKLHTHAYVSAFSTYGYAYNADIITCTLQRDGGHVESFYLKSCPMTLSPYFA